MTDEDRSATGAGSPSGVGAEGQVGAAAAYGLIGAATSRAATSPAATTWMSQPAAIQPTVLILGGFLTVPPMYRPLVQRLKDRGAAGAVVASVWTPDWLLAGARGIGPICSRSAKALRAAIRLSDELSEGAPLLVIGHSAGGITGRLLTAPEPVQGRRLGAARWIGAIVTLGTPHRLAAGQGIGRRINDVAASTAAAIVPGAFFAPEIGYLTVASRAIRGDPSGTGRERVAHLLYRSVIGRAAVPGTEGDGLVPVVAAGLEGARQVVLDGAAHGVSGGPWYGSADAVDVWWPIALETWRSALEHRAQAARAAG
jgi:hypothetical protein